ncbi:MAG: exosortase/archaeosortase family protein [Opitutaceae bacterium]
MSHPRPLASFASLPTAAKVSVFLLGGLMVSLCALLWPHWLHNPDLSHGLFMPVVFLLLLRESRTGTLRFFPRGGLFTAAFVTLLLGGLLALAAGGLYAAALGWSHDLVAFVLTFALVLLLAAGVAVLASTALRFVPFNWSIVVALILWLLCAPIPPGTYSRLTLSLQLMVSENVLRALHLLGIAASRHGNILELATTSVGIEEACSGVRSLISCIFAGLFFSASLVRRPWSRVLIIGLAAPLALVMNFLRSLTLTLLANSGVSIAGHWHDFTGFAVLGITAALLAGLALLLERKASGQSSAVSSSLAAPTENRFSLTPDRAPARLLAISLAIAAALTLFFYANTRPAEHRDAPVPDLAALLPLEAAGWRIGTATNLYQFRDTLQTDHLVQRTYTRMTEHGIEKIIIYLAYWPSGQASVSLVSSHTPDACWPGSGWEAVPVANPRVSLTVGQRTLPLAEARSFESGDFPQNVWFWHLYDGRSITQQNPRSPKELLRLAWHYGFRHEGDQLFVRISSNLPWNDIAQEPLLENVFTRLQPLGL